MREIKFRGMTVAPGNGVAHKPEMVYGSLRVKPNYDAFIFWYKRTKSGKETWGRRAVDFRTVGQLTGIKDAHDNELYEGDICWDAHNEYYGQVIWDEGAWCYQWDNIIENLNDCAHSIELMGNIHQNNDLIGE